MPRIVKEPDIPLSEDTRPAHVASGVAAKPNTNRPPAEENLMREADTDLQDAEGVFRSPWHPGDLLAATVGGLAAILGSHRLSADFRPVAYGIGCLIFLGIVAACGVAYLIVSLVSR